MSDDEDKLLSDLNSVDVRQEGPDNGENSDQKPKVADWRYGPAQIWYDMLEVPDSGEGFNYGFKTKQDKTSSALSKFTGDRSATSAATEVDQDQSIADDAFLMVSQLHWEDDVVWDGNDIKAKVLQKLNSKTNAAGWLPSSGSRTAGAFSQPGKSALPVGNSGSNSGGNSGKQNSGGSTKKALQR